MKRSIMMILYACAFFSAHALAQVPGSTIANNAGPAAETASPLEQQLLDNLKQYVQASTQKNVDYFKRTLTDDFISVPKNGGTSDRADFLEDISSPEEQKEKEPRVYGIKVIPLNETAALVTYDEVVAGDQPRYRHITQVWVKQPDRWKLKFLQTTPNTWSIGDTD
jgi:hypothetical protein